MAIETLYIYDIATPELRIVNYREDGYTDYVTDTFRLRAVAKNRDRAVNLAVKFLWHVYGERDIDVDFNTKMSVRKSAPAWAGATPDCDWPSAYEYGCMTLREYEIERLIEAI